MRLPSVIALKEYIASTRHPRFSRGSNVFLRDSFQLPILRAIADRRPT